VRAFRFVEANRAEFPVAFMCARLGVSPSGFYAWRHRPPSARAAADAALTGTIAAIHRASRGTYGAPRVHAELADAHGVRCGRKRVARLMRQAGLAGCHRRRSVRTTRRDEAAAPAPDLVQRAFAADAPDRLWVADITYLPTWSGVLYLAVVLDACSRRVVGWAAAQADHPRAELVVDALEMALRHRRPAAGLIHHSDRGGQGGFKGSSQRPVGASVAVVAARLQSADRQRSELVVPPQEGCVQPSARVPSAPRGEAGHPTC
jgi:putative transposase